MKKKVDIHSYANTLRGESVFFPTKHGHPQPDHAGEPIEETRQEEKSLPLSPLPLAQEVPATSQLAAQLASEQASNHASTLALSAEMIDRIRKIVRNPGKQDVLYIRLTQEEKASLGDITHSYKRKGIKTSDNEIVRLAVNMLLEDYKRNGETSLLAIMLASLHDS